MNQSGPEVYQQAMRSALRLLRGRDMTEAEIFTRLLTKGFSEFESKAVVSSLARQGFICDGRIVDRAVELALNEKPIGRLKLEMELKARGAKEPAIEKALASIPNGHEQEIADREAARIKSKGGSVSSAAGFLSRRGFDEDTISITLERVFGLEA